MKGENMTEKEYRSHPALSRSELWQFHKSAEWFKWKKDHPSEPTPALLFGQVAHKLLLEPEDFDTDFAVAPVVDKRTKAGKEAWEQFCADADGKTVVDAATYEQCMAMVSAARTNPLVNDLLQGNHEEPFFWTDPDTGVQCKARLDSWHRDENGIPVVVDYKTTADASYRAFQRDVQSYGYFFQAAMYSEGLIQNGRCPRRIKEKPKRRWQRDPETGKRKYWTEYQERIVMGGTEGEIIHPRFIFIVQEKTEPYSVNVFEMDMDYMALGYDLYREYLGTYASCESLGYYPGYLGPMNEPNILTLPSWMNRGDDS